MTVKRGGSIASDSVMANVSSDALQDANNLVGGSSSWFSSWFGKKKSGPKKKSSPKKKSTPKASPKSSPKKSGAKRKRGGSSASQAVTQLVSQDAFDAMSARFTNLMGGGGSMSYGCPAVAAAKPGAAKPGVAKPGVAKPGAAKPSLTKKPGAMMKKRGGSTVAAFDGECGTDIPADAGLLKLATFDPSTHLRVPQPMPAGPASDIPNSMYPPLSTTYPDIVRVDKQMYIPPGNDKVYLQHGANFFVDKGHVGQFKTFN